MNVALIGSGSWGTAVAGLAAARAERVTMWAHSEQTAAGINGEHRNPRYLVDYVLPENVVATTDLSQALDGAEAIIFAVPSTHLRDVCHQAAPFIADETPVLCLTKGIEPESGLLMSEVIASEIGNESRVAALSGPNHAEEICRGRLSAAVIASKDQQVGETFKELLLSTAFRIYLSQDMTGVEVCGAMKNVIAIVCGISAGSGAGDNTLALIMTRGPPGARPRRSSHDLHGACRHGRPYRHLHFGAFAQPHLWLRVRSWCVARRVPGPHAYGGRRCRRGPQRQRARPFTGRRHSAHLCRGANTLQRCYFG